MVKIKFAPSPRFSDPLPNKCRQPAVSVGDLDRTAMVLSGPTSGGILARMIDSRPKSTFPYLNKPIMHAQSLALLIVLLSDLLCLSLFVQISFLVSARDVTYLIFDVYDGGEMELTRRPCSARSNHVNLIRLTRPYWINCHVEPTTATVQRTM
jgi:hypothetical protein